MTAIYLLENVTHDSETQEVLDAMRRRLSRDFGVTVTGNRCTIRWDLDGQPVDVHMVITDVTTVTESRTQIKRAARMQELYKKYPELSADLQFAETGE